MNTVASSFDDLALIEPIRRALATIGYQTPTPIQAQAIPHLLQGKDLLGCARTGTGKTAAFALPILEHLSRAGRSADARGPRALVLAPTRELALQIGESFAEYGRHLGLRGTVICGGVSQGPQVSAIRQGIDILVATPGRLLDLMQQGVVRLDSVQTFVLDEADRMLDMGFIPAVRRIVAALPRKRQTVLFSATMPPDIAALAAGILVAPVKVAVDPESSTVEDVSQWVLFVERAKKGSLLGSMLRDPKMTRVLVFTRTKHGANRVAEHLERDGVRAQAIHGNKSQGARQRALEGFKSGQVRVLVATDLASRGIDVDGITHVINFDLPHEPQSYVHRIGRTARAGASGVALSMCAAEERTLLREIEKLTQTKLSVVQDHPHRDSSSGPGTAVPPANETRRPGRPPRRGFGGGRRPSAYHS